MKQATIIYGSSTGNCENIAHRIAKALGVAASSVVNASNLTSELISNNTNLILGSSTWGSGDLQDDWYDAIKGNQVIESRRKNCRHIRLR